MMVMDTLRQILEKINTRVNFDGVIKFDEPMSLHTSFKIGGPADVYIKPDKTAFSEYVPLLLKTAGENNIPLFILGAGANILVSDRGIRGIVLDTGSWKGIDYDVSEQAVKVLSGTSIDELVDTLADAGLSGLEFLAGMPGSAGGSVWMNARCYEKSISDVLIETEILDEEQNRMIIPFKMSDFSYKKSPFQERNVFILSASFSTVKKEPELIKKDNECYRKDRTEKGHYSFPSAGSTFKNNHAFGEPTGKIIDKAGMKGLQIGGAQVAPWHGNIIINKDNARAVDVRMLIDKITEKIREERGFELEREVLYIGEWE